MSTPRRALSILLLLVGPLALDALAGDANSFRVLDRKKVYRGFADGFSAPVVVDSVKVLDSLAPMKRIRDEQIAKDSARWLVLVHEANQKFQTVLATVCKEGSYDLVAEIGAVTGPRAITDITDTAIAVAARP